jgi:hypothetical protein
MALTGAILGNRCYPSQSDALDVLYSQMAPAQSAGLTSYVTQFVKSGAAWYQSAYSIDATGVWSLRYSTLAPVPSFPACDPSEKFFDGLTMGWGVATAMILVACTMLLRRGARGG